MKKILYLSLFLLLTSTHQGCSKVKSKKWLVADLSITDFDTGEAVSGWVVLRYKQTSMFGSSPEQFETIGLTDQDGKLHIEHPIEKNYVGMELHIYPPGPYHWSTSIPTYRKIGVYATSQNKHNVVFQAIYQYNLTVKNVGCTGSSDSLLINGHGSISWEPEWFYFTGCIDTTFVGNKATHKGEVIRWMSKKNGVLDSGIISPTYIFNQTIPVLLEY